MILIFFILLLAGCKRKNHAGRFNKISRIIKNRAMERRTNEGLQRQSDDESRKICGFVAL
jgi:hypothetical protein